MWPGRSDAELVECELNESLLDMAFANGQPWRLLCTYDLDSLDDRSSRRRDAATPPARPTAIARALIAPTPASLAGALPPAPAAARTLAFAGDDLAELRAFLTRCAAEEGIQEEHAEELVLAVNELATNSVRYGGGHGELRVWREPAGLVCEVRDEGHIADPLVGRSRPAAQESSGRGLWLANQLCDLVQIRSTPAGSTVRVLKCAP